MNKQLDLIAGAPATRLAKRASTAKSMPGVKLDKSQKGGSHLKVSVVTEKLMGVTKAGNENWKVIKVHAQFFGSMAHRSAEQFMELMSKGLTPTPDNQCVADGVNINSLPSGGGIPTVHLS
jgi:hypothetical protein